MPNLGQYRWRQPRDINTLVPCLVSLDRKTLRIGISEDCNRQETRKSACSAENAKMAERGDSNYNALFVFFNLQKTLAAQ
jgi:hypothetical protein